MQQSLVLLHLLGNFNIDSYILAADFSCLRLFCILFAEKEGSCC